MQTVKQGWEKFAVVFQFLAASATHKHKRRKKSQTIKTKLIWVEKKDKHLVIFTVYELSLMINFRNFRVDIF